MKAKISKINQAYIFFVLLIFVTTQLNAQWTMGKTFGALGNNEYTRGLSMDASGNLYVIGSYSNSDPQHDFDGQPLVDLPTVFGSNHGLVFAKYDASNNLQFVKSYRCMKSSTEASQITDPRMAVTPTGEVVIAGTYRHSIEIEGQTLTATQTGFAESNMFVAKFDNSGTLSWLKNVDTYGATCKDIAFTSTGDIILGGSYDQAIDFGNGISNSGSSSRDWGFLCKLAGTDGTAQTLEIFDGGHPAKITMGSTGEMIVIGQFRKSQIDFSDNTTLFLKTPETNSNLKLNNFVAKFSSALAPVWIKQVRGNSEGTAEATWVGNNLKLMLNNRYYLALGTDSIDGTTNAVVNMDPATGNVISIVEAGDFLYGMASNTTNTFLFTERAQGNTFSFGSYSIAMPEKFAFFAIDQNDSVQWAEMINSVSIPGMRADVMAASATDVVIGGSVASFDTINLSPTVALNVNEQLYTTGWFAKYSVSSGGMSVREENKVSRFTVYPNPATEFIMVQPISEEAAENIWQILGIDGQIYKSGRLEGNDSLISVKELPPGMYLLSISTQSGRNETKRFIKKR